MSQSLHIDIDSPSTKAAKATSAPTITVQAAGRVKLDKKVVQLSGYRASVGRGQTIKITNGGSGTLRLDNNSISFSGTDATYFQLIAGSLPRTLKPGKSATYTIAYNGNTNAPIDRVLTATLNVKQAGSSTVSGTVSLRAAITAGRGGLNEPSLARLLELYQYQINDGDTDPNSTLLNLDGSATDEIFAPRFTRAGSGAVTVQTIAQFVPDSNTVAGRFGYYDPGSPGSRKELFSIKGIDAQTVNPTVNGSSAFDPGAKPFSLWAEAPTFLDANGEARIIYGEDALNTFESNSAERRKVRVYPLKENGQTVSNAYVVAFEEYELENDQNDYVFVIRNVTALASRPEIGLIALDGQPDANRLAFNRIETNTQQYYSQFHDVSTVRIVNTGNQDLNISSIALAGTDASVFQITAGGSATTLQRNETLDVTVRFIAHSGALRQASLVIASNDSDEPTKTVALSGFWQSVAEADSNGVSDEPSLNDIFRTLGYRTSAVNAGEHIDNKGKVEAVGDEILSTNWRAADTGKPVTIQQLAGFHQTNTASYVAWYDRGRPWYYITDPRYNAQTNGNENRLFRMNQTDTQTLFQRKDGSTTEYARASFTPSGAFAMRVDGELSDDNLNVQQPGDLGGHHMRFYPVRDATGAYVADSYLMTMDFSSINFDYNDHVFLLQNLRPVDRTDAVTGLAGVGGSNGNALDWADVDEAKGYYVLRADKAGGTFTRLTSDILTTSSFLDDRAKPGKTYYYRVVALNSNGNETVPANVDVRRPA